VAAAVYAGSEGLKALVVEDSAIGGQAGTSSRIENYMGFPTGISGADLTFRGQVQAMKFGTCFAMPRRVEGLARRGNGFCVTLDDGEEVCARSVLVATGVQYRRLPIDRLEEFEGAGVYYAATEMEARLCDQTEAVVVGGGNSAGQAAMYLSRVAKQVHVLVRGGSLAETMSAYLRERLEADPRITIHTGSQLERLDGEGHLERVVVTTPSGSVAFECRALFIMIGAAPNTRWLSGLVELDGHGFVRTGTEVGAASSYATSCPGVFAVGDVRSGSVKRVASSVGEGSVVVSAIWSHVNAPPPPAVGIGG
jgi:thioredoxin reductase (NADPH)